jgi:hypothetical protein
VRTYLDIGTGYACAWQNRAIVWLLFSLKAMLLSEFENEGALKPIGSEQRKIKSTMAK